MTRQEFTEKLIKLPNYSSLLTSFNHDMYEGPGKLIFTTTPKEFNINFDENDNIEDHNPEQLLKFLENF